MVKNIYTGTGVGVHQNSSNPQYFTALMGIYICSNKQCWNRIVENGWNRCRNDPGKRHKPGSSGWWGAYSSTPCI